MSRFAIASFAATLQDGFQRDAFARFANDRPFSSVEAFVYLQEARRSRGEAFAVAPRQYMGG